MSHRMSVYSFLISLIMFNYEKTCPLLNTEYLTVFYYTIHEMSH